MRERDVQQKVELQRKRWSRKEEGDFYRTLMAYGVDYSVSEKKFSWTRFRQLSRIDKFDDVFTDYYQAFVAMCKRILGQPLTEEEGNKSIFYKS
jgi:hypothetical protein